MGYFSANSWPMPTDCDPWPGKMNASRDGFALGKSFDSFMIENLMSGSGFRFRRRWMKRRESALNRLIDAAFGKFRRHPHRIFDRVRVGGAMGDNADPFQSQQRCTTVFGVVDAFFEVGKCAA